MNAKDWNGHVPDEDSGTPRDVATEALLQLAEVRGFVRAMSIVADQNLKWLEALGERKPA